MSAAATISNASTLMGFMGEAVNAVRKPLVHDDMHTALRAARASGNVIEMKPHFDEVKKLADQALKDAGLHGKGALTQDQMKELTKRIQDTSEYKAASVAVGQKRSKGGKFTAGTAIVGGGLGFLAGGLLGAAVGTLGKIVTGGSDKVNFKAITGWTATAVGGAVGIAAGLAAAFVASPVSIVNAFRNRGAAKRNDALEHMVKTTLRKSASPSASPAPTQGQTTQQPTQAPQAATPEKPFADVAHLSSADKAVRMTELMTRSAALSTAPAVPVASTPAAPAKVTTDTPAPKVHPMAAAMSAAAKLTPGSVSGGESAALTSAITAAKTPEPAQNQNKGIA